MKSHIVSIVTAVWIAACTAGCKPSPKRPAADSSSPAPQPLSTESEAAAGPKEPAVLPGYGCVGPSPVSRGLSTAEAEQVVRAAAGAGKFFARIMPFVGADEVQRIAILYHDGEDEYGEAHAVVRERGADGGFKDIYTFEPDRFVRHTLTLVDADGDGNPEVLYDGYDGGSGGYIYRTELYSPPRKEAFWWESTWARTEKGDDESVLKESTNLKNESGKLIRDWFVANVNGSGNQDTDNGGLKKPCGDAVVAPVSDSRGTKCGNALLPLFPGAKWQYRLARGADPGNVETWVLAVDRPPSAGAEGISSAGPPEKLRSYPLVSDGGNLRLDGLGFLGAPSFVESTILRVEGETLPRAERFFEGAAWELRVQRKVTYRITNKQGKVLERTGLAEERHRALAGEVDTVRTPAGTFHARRISWTSRVNLRTHGRPVLIPLTSAPYRTETMWVAPCVGVVKRRITFAEETETVLLELYAAPVSPN